MVAAPRIERQRQQQSKQFVGLVCGQVPVWVRLKELPHHPSRIPRRAERYLVLSQAICDNVQVLRHIRGLRVFLAKCPRLFVKRSFGE